MDSTGALDDIARLDDTLPIARVPWLHHEAAVPLDPGSRTGFHMVRRADIADIALALTCLILAS